MTDRRPGQAAYGSGADRSKVEAYRDATGSETLTAALLGGVRCVDGTPGPKALESLLLARVWGVRPE